MVFFLGPSAFVRLYSMVFSWPWCVCKAVFGGGFISLVSPHLFST